MFFIKPQTNGTFFDNQISYTDKIIFHIMLSIIVIEYMKMLDKSLKSHIHYFNWSILVFGLSIVIISRQVKLLL